MHTHMARQIQERKDIFEEIRQKFDKLWTHKKRTFEN